MAGGRMHTPHSTPLDSLLAISGDESRGDMGDGIPPTSQLQQCF